MMKGDRLQVQVGGGSTLAATHSPLDKLVRQHSKKARTSPYARPPQVVISPDDEYPREHGHRTHSPVRDSPASQQSQPQSPLLHTRFGRDTSRYSDLSERSSTLDGDSAYQDDLDDAHRPFSHLTTATNHTRASSPDSPVLPPSPGLEIPPPGSFARPPPLQPAPPPRRSDVDPFAFRNYESQQLQRQQSSSSSASVPSVVVHGAQSDDGHSIHSTSSQRESRHRVPVQIPVEDRPRFNFSRPLRRQDPPPPAPSPSHPLPSASPPQLHNPYMRQQQQQQPSGSPPQPPSYARPPPPPIIRTPSPPRPYDEAYDDADSVLAYDAPEPSTPTPRENLFALANKSASGAGGGRHPYAYVSGTPSNYEYDDTASPVEISPLTPHPTQPPLHTFSSPDKNVTTPWARAERRKTLPPQGGFEMQLDNSDVEDEDPDMMSPESERAMAFHAAAFDDASPTRSIMSGVSASVYDDTTLRTQGTARSSAYSTALPAPGRSYEDESPLARLSRAEAESPRATHFDERSGLQRHEYEQDRAFPTHATAHPPYPQQSKSQYAQPLSPEKPAQIEQRSALSPQDTRAYSPQQQQPMHPQDRAFSPQQVRGQSPQPFPRGASPQPYYPQQQQQRAVSPQPARGPSPHPPPVYPPPSADTIYPNSSPTQRERGPSPSPQRGPSPSPQQQQRTPIPPPPPEPQDDPHSKPSRADRGVSYYSTTSSYFPPPSAHPAGHVQLPNAPPSPHFDRPASSTSLYSNYSYYNIPPSPTGSGGGQTPTEERFGHTLVPTATGRDDRGPGAGPSGGGGGGYGAGPSGGGGGYGAGPSNYAGQRNGPSYGAGPSSYGAPPPQPRGSPSSQQGHGREASDSGTLRAARDFVVAGRASEDTIREKDQGRGWFGRRERRPSHESSGRRSPAGTSFYSASCLLHSTPSSLSKCFAERRTDELTFLVP
ncbi:hypothetical protein EXIGLDRAFT_650496 [Exidia glandulosa HHB12029]|uniref:Uncharacterized protein n=1 Tax=Exidia glandulosa HHB12029 TaxID=1314781 RepID=A0A165FJ51_EXIGL|nr:hypothetical protein EXIGLDRAFT_650496 [Exidia glandulosa HHB12029]